MTLVMPRRFAPAALASSLAGLAALSFPACSKGDTDYGQVAMYVADMLQKHHYSRQDFDDEISRRLFDHYLDFLDFNHQYFTAEDIDRFTRLYATNLDDQILVGDIQAAHKIYETFETRVRERVAKIRELLENEKFTFDSDRSIQLSREDQPWPANEDEADTLWRNIIEGELLQEKLRLVIEEEEGEEDPSDADADPGTDAPEAPDSADAATPDSADAPEAPGSADAPEAQDSADVATPGSALDTTAPDSADIEGFDEPGTPEERILKRYDRFLQSLDENDEEDVVNFFLTSLSSAYDPHSDWFSQGEWDNFAISMRNSLVGIGALLSMKDGAAEIQGLIVNGPAEKSGILEVGDRIVGVGEGKEGPIEDVMYMKLQKIVEKIRGRENSVVRLKIVPADGDPSQTEVIQIVREEVKLKDKLATAQLIETTDPTGQPRRLGWIELPSFYADMEERTTSTTADVRRLLERLMAENIAGLVLDLRGNGGGSLEEAINLTGLFIKRGPVVQSKDWRENTDARSSRERFPVYEGPMIVLTDKASASASEILAAALQDYHRALIVGEKSTFGKGTVQTILPVAQYMPFFSEKDRAGRLKVTIQKFYRIAGGSTQLRGVVPDLKLPSTRDALEIGEESLDNPLPYDEIPKLDYELSSESPLLVEELRSRHVARIGEDPEFQYVLEDTNRLKEQMDRNTVSLNEARRLEEVRLNRERREARKKAREDRLTAIAGDGGDDRFRVFQLTLDNVDAEDLVPDAEFTDVDSTGMILKDERSPKKEGSEFPYGMDPPKLETLFILQDLIELGSPAYTAKVGESGTP